MMHIKNTIAAVTILFLFLTSGCAQNYTRAETGKLPRLEGRRGPLAPVVTSSGVLFRLYAPDATLVYLIGPFNGWDDEAAPMKKDKDGVWSIEIKLPHQNKIQYKFCIDGYWIGDPDNPEVENDGYGGENSLVWVD